MDRDKNWFEKLLGVIPGYEGYRDREAMRETDAVLRRAVADRLDAAKHKLDDVIEERTRAGDILSLDPLGQAQAKLGRLADSMRYAARGATGWLDDYKIDETVLEKLHQTDEEVADQLEEINAALAERSEGEDPGPLAGKLKNIVEQMNKKLEERQKLLTGGPDLSTQE